MAYLTAAVGLVWFVSVLRLGAFIHGWRPELHHFYYGLALVYIPHCGWLGLGIMADDAIQHFVQLWYPDFRSPLHLLARYTWYRWVSWP